MIIVSDASPIINLAIIGRLDILPAIFGQVIVPQKVFEEITIQGAEMPGADEVRAASWVEVRNCTNTSLVLALQLQVDPGEAEAIALALETSAQLFGLCWRPSNHPANLPQGRSTAVVGVLATNSLPAKSSTNPLKGFKKNPLPRIVSGQGILTFYQIL